MMCLPEENPAPSYAGATMHGVPIREPYPSENQFFRANPKVAGMAAEDDAVTLNPFAGLDKAGELSVLRNEAARVGMRNSSMRPSFDVTPEQQSAFRGTAYERDPQALRETIAARAVSGDPSAGALTPEQSSFARMLRMTFGDYARDSK